MKLDLVKLMGIIEDYAPDEDRIKVQIDGDLLNIEYADSHPVLVTQSYVMQSAIRLSDYRFLYNGEETLRSLCIKMAKGITKAKKDTSEQEFSKRFDEVGGFITVGDDLNRIPVESFRVMNPFCDNDYHYVNGKTIFEVIVPAESVGEMLDEHTWITKEFYVQCHFFKGTNSGDWFARMKTNHFKLN